MTAYNCEVFELAMVPMFALGDTWFADVDGYLSAVQGMNQFGEAASGIYVHLVIVDGLLLGEVRQVGCHQLVSEGALGEVDHVDAVLVGCCIGTLMDDVNNLSQCSFVSHWAVAVQVIF